MYYFVHLFNVSKTKKASASGCNNYYGLPDPEDPNRKKWEQVKKILLFVGGVVGGVVVIYFVYNWPSLFGPEVPYNPAQTDGANTNPIGLSQNLVVVRPAPGEGARYVLDGYPRTALANIIVPSTSLSQLAKMILPISILFANKLVVWDGIFYYKSNANSLIGTSSGLIGTPSEATTLFECLDCNIKLPDTYSLFFNVDVPIGMEIKACTLSDVYDLYHMHQDMSTLESYKWLNFHLTLHSYYNPDDIVYIGKVTKLVEESNSFFLREIDICRFLQVLDLVPISIDNTSFVYMDVLVSSINHLCEQISVSTIHPDAVSWLLLHTKVIFEHILQLKGGDSLFLYFRANYDIVFDGKSLIYQRRF